jgi:hypothetical protein
MMFLAASSCRSSPGGSRRRASSARAMASWCRPADMRVLADWIVTDASAALSWALR